MNTSYEAVKAALVANYGWAMDDERAARVASYDKSPLKIAAIARAGECAVAIIPERIIHRVQKLYVDEEGTVRLSTEEVNPSLCIGHSAGNIENSVLRYNEAIGEDPDWCVKLTDIFHLVEEVVVA